MVCCGLLAGTAVQDFLSLLAFVGKLGITKQRKPKVFSSFLAPPLFLFLCLNILLPSLLAIYSRLRHCSVQQHFLNLSVSVYIRPQGLYEEYNVYSS